MNNSMSRRRLLASLGGLSASVLAGALPAWADDHGRSPAPGASAPALLPATGITGKVVVVGGGMAGATVAKYLRLWGGSGIQVTLIERESVYTSNILSNLVLNGNVTMNALYFNYARLVSGYGVKVLQATVDGIQPDLRRVHYTQNGVAGELAYDRLVVAPGIDFDFPPGLTTVDAQLAAPHAWKAGAQTLALRDQLQTMPAGGTFLLAIPAKPYRCPPGPYERACVVADWLKRNRPGSKVLVLDANPSIAAEVATFTQAFNVTYQGIITYVPNAAVTSVDVAAHNVNTTFGPFHGDVLNIIPPHRAGRIVADAGLANDAAGRFAVVNVLSYESTARPNIHVIGDAAATTQPKAGHIANQEAKVCADAIIRMLSGRSPDPSPVTNSACYSPITATTASWLTAVFAYDPVAKAMVAVPASSGEANGPTRDHYEDMFLWFDTLMKDSFA
jgi:NADPH-dependent 2,4-dienoyl-CoA reductase/sulfur reductase-like enzyme